MIGRGSATAARHAEAASSRARAALGQATKGSTRGQASCARSRRLQRLRVDDDTHGRAQARTAAPSRRHTDALSRCSGGYAGRVVAQGGGGSRERAAGTMRAWSAWPGSASGYPRGELAASVGELDGGGGLCGAGLQVQRYCRDINSGIYAW
ncbi:hypothetical protein FA95DRAFT_1423569 [Auriscalpium vulgare]|uniref:Uncharacterized protein n=1 Tax=Auriscalpium vulgare TaxID=40419 RepID=A0ACB8R0F7_9AGAM|nr:hypothetical protein FA95DRAFT_1423569 [Auriscalpium vulgare]